MKLHLLEEMIGQLEDYRESMHFAELLVAELPGADAGKLECHKRLERIVNEAKRELAILKANT